MTDARAKEWRIGQQPDTGNWGAQVARASYSSITSEAIFAITAVVFFLLCITFASALFVNCPRTPYSACDRKWERRSCLFRVPACNFDLGEASRGSVPQVASLSSFPSSPIMKKLGGLYAYWGSNPGWPAAIGDAAEIRVCKANRFTTTV